MVGDVLWQEILRNPDDDGPRLVYADWLEQTGDPEQQARAALIQAQLALETLATKAQRAPHEARVRAVMKQWRRHWVKPLWMGHRWMFRRGFLDGPRMMSATTFAQHATEMFEHAPLARTFRFGNAANEMIPLVDHPSFVRVAHADFRGLCHCGVCPVAKELQHLFASPHASGLKKLGLSDCRFDDSLADVLARSPLLPNLVALDLSENRITDTAARTLAAALAPHTRIDLRNNSISKETVRALRSQLGARAKL